MVSNASNEFLPKQLNSDTNNISTCSALQYPRIVEGWALSVFLCSTYLFLKDLDHFHFGVCCIFFQICNLSFGVLSVCCATNTGVDYCFHCWMVFDDLTLQRWHCFELYANKSKNIKGQMPMIRYTPTLLILMTNSLINQIGLIT